MEMGASPTPKRELQKLAGLVNERLAHPLVDEAHLHELLMGGEVPHGGYARRPRPVRIAEQHLLPAHHLRRRMGRLNRYGAVGHVTLHGRPPSA